MKVNKVAGIQKLYSVQRRNSALHMAVREGNNKIVDTVLTYMAKIDINAS